MKVNTRIVKGNGCQGNGRVSYNTMVMKGNGHQNQVLLSYVCAICKGQVIIADIT